MIYSKKYSSPLGEIILNSDGENLTALCFIDGKDYSRYIKIKESEEKNLPIFDETIKWLDINDIAKKIAKKHDLKRMSAQAVGGAVGWNPICIIVPCHRVIGTNGSLTGYGGGIKNKIELLKLEGVNTDKYSIPTKGTAL